LGSSLSSSCIKNYLDACWCAYIVAAHTYLVLRYSSYGLPMIKSSVGIRIRSLYIRR
jgi:hypothetical protein